MTTEKLSWADLENQLYRVGSFHPHTGPTEAAREYVLANADRIRSIPTRRILATAERDWNANGVAALFILESLGRVALERDDAYVRAILFARTGSLSYVRYEPEIPDLVEVVQRALAIGAIGLVRRRWHPDVVRWVAEGRLDRAETQRAILTALAAGFGNVMADWYIALYLSLEPTDDEYARDQGLMRGMLRAPERATVKFALERASALHDGQRLETAAFLTAAPDLASTSAVNARSVLRIAEQGAAADPAAIDAARRVFASALAHPKRDVQSIAVSWLGAHDGEAAVAEAAPLLHPLVTAPIDDGEESAPRGWRPFEPWPADEILERTGVLFRDSSDPLEIEAGLHAWSTMADPTELAPLYARLRGPDKPGWNSSTEYVPSATVGWLIATVLAASAGVDWWHDPNEYRVKGFQVFPPLMESRFDQVRRRVLLRRPPQVLLSTPCSSAGWVDADALIGRLQATIDSRAVVGVADFTAALLRLHPDDHGTAVAAAARARSSEVWAVLSYALGGPPARVRTVEWWVAAARSRSDGPDEHLAAAGLRLPGQALPLDTAVRIEWVPLAHRPTQRFHHAELISPSNGPSATMPADRYEAHPLWLDNQPTVILSRQGRFRMNGFDPSVVRWAGIIWPGSAEFAASLGVLQLADSAIENAEHYENSATIDAIAASPGEIGEIGRSCIALGLSGKHRMLRAQTAELLAEHGGGRLDLEALASTMIRMLIACKLSRWAEALADAAAISARGRHSVIRLLTELLPRLDRSAGGIVLLVEVLDNELRRSGTAPNDAALLAWLADFTGSSKAARAAKSVLELTR